MQQVIQDPAGQTLQDTIHEQSLALRNTLRESKELLSALADLEMPAGGQAAKSAVHRFFRNQFVQLFDRIEHGCIKLTDPLGSLEFGEQTSELKCRVTIADLNTYTQIALGGSTGSGEAYIDGGWSCDHPTRLVQIMIRNRRVLERMESGPARLAQYLLRSWHALNRNSRSGSRKNIAAHYDLGNEFFRLFLDRRMMYSSALYCADDDLESASERKLRRICNTLELGPEDHLLEIGGGWGGLACYAAQHTGCRVTTITISREQFEEASTRVQEFGLEQQVTVKLRDYRDLDGQYDKIVSIEMIEAVGHQYLDHYFKVINQSLKPGGKAMIQAIVIDDAQYQRALKEVDYIKRFIFPGSFIPCYSVITGAAGRNRLMLEDLHDMGISYAQTLRDWRERFYQALDTIREQGYDSRFLRMWEFYLCYCEGGFKERAISVGQLLFRKQPD